MRQLAGKLKKIPNYISRFGFFHGSRLFFFIEKPVPHNSDKQESIKVPGFPGTIILRKTISDHSAFWICLVAEQYKVNRFPSHTKRLHEAYDSMLRDGRTPLIIDAGANIGMSAIWYANEYPEAHIFAIEPDHENYRLLVENTREYNGRITTFHGGIWPRDAWLSIKDQSAGAQHYVTIESQTKSHDAMEAITIQKILSLTSAKNIFIAKIDIEGSQKELFKENTEWVKLTGLIILELDDWLFPWAGTSRPFFSCISHYAFDYLIDGENIFCFHDIESKNGV